MDHYISEIFSCVNNYYNRIILSIYFNMLSFYIFSMLIITAIVSHYELYRSNFKLIQSY